MTMTWNLRDNSEIWPRKRVGRGMGEQMRNPEALTREAADRSALAGS